MPEQQPHAIVVGIDTMQGLQTARILSARNIPVVAIAKNPSHHACSTRVCERILQADTEGAGLIEALISLGPTLASKAVIYPCHDQCVRLISRHRDALTAWYHIMLADADTVEMLMDKDRFYDLARDIGIAVPQTFALRSRKDAEQAATALRFPCVVKPVRRGPAWNSQTMSKVFHAENAGEFLAIYDQVNGWAPELLVQQWITGTDADLYSCNCYFDRRSKLIASFVARKLRQWPPRVGSSCLGEECRNETVLTTAIQIFERVGYHGLGYIEMKRDSRTGEHFVIEANVGRPTGRSAIAEAGGVDMLYAMYCDAVGQPLPAELEQKYLGVKWIDLRHDIQSAISYYRRGELTFADWYESWRGPKAHAVFSWSDPRPFWVDLWRALVVLLSRKQRALRQHSAFAGSAKSMAVLSNSSKDTKS